MKKICVYCGSNSGNRPIYQNHAYKLGACLAEKGIELVYGGASVGLMGCISSAVLSNGGKVTGIIPQSLADRVGGEGLSRMIIAADMHERKKLMFDMADGFIALPGGIGTLEELLEVMTWAQLGFHGKPAGLLNVDGYFNSILKFLDAAVQAQFLKNEHKDMLLVSDEPEVLLHKLTKYTPSSVNKWF